MIEIHHLNCVKIVSPINDNVCGHCILIRENDRMILVDAGIGLLDIADPNARIGDELIKMVGYRFDESQTAYRQIEGLGLDPNKVTDCIITHLDNDHTGGLADFPNAIVHLSIEEWNSYQSGNARYLKAQLSHQPTIRTYDNGFQSSFLELNVRPVNLGTETEFYLVPLFGHTFGHCGVLIKTKEQCIFYVGDAYYMNVELSDADHPVHQLAKLRAEDESLRLESLETIKKFIVRNPDVKVFAYHDIEEFYQLK